MFLDKDANEDRTPRRRSTFVNAHARFRLFTGREDPGGRDEQYEQLYIVLLDASSAHARLEAYRVGETERSVPMAEVLDDLVSIVAIRNPDFYEYKDGSLTSVSA